MASKIIYNALLCMSLIRTSNMRKYSNRIGPGCCGLSANLTQRESNNHLEYASIIEFPVLFVLLVQYLPKFANKKVRNLSIFT